MSEGDSEQHPFSLQSLPSTTHDYILRDLSFCDLRNYSLVNKEARLTVIDYHHRAFNIETFLRPYFDSHQVKQFRLLQQRTGCLISGSTALSFFTREVYDSSDLDLYVQVTHSRAVVEFFVSVGYTYKPYKTEWKNQDDDWEKAIEDMIVRMNSDEQEVDWDGSQFEGYPMSGIEDVFCFTKGGKDVQVVASTSNPLSVVLSFHSTALMNVITHSNAISLYPRATFIDKISLLNNTEGTNTERHALALEKYRQRGWTILETLDAVESLDSKSAFHTNFRNISDHHCWLIDLLPIEMEAYLETPIFTIQSWALEHNAPRNVSMQWEIVHWSTLEWNYCVAPEIYRGVELLPHLPSMGFQAPPEGKKYLDDKLISHLISLYYNIRTRMRYTMQDDHPQKAEELLLSAFRKCRQQYPDLDEEFLPRSSAAQVLKEHIAVVYDTYNFHQLPKFEFTFAQNREGYVWTNVKITIEDITGPRRNWRVRHPVRAIANEDAVVSLRAFRIGLKVEWVERWVP